MENRLRILRENKNWSQKQVSQYLHCSQQVYSNYELGQRGIPNQVLVSLAKLYSTSADYILGLTDIEKPYPHQDENIR